MSDEKTSPTWVSSISQTRPIIGKDMGIPVTTFPRILREYVAKYPDNIQYVTNDDKEYTLRQFYDLSISVAKSFISLGLEQFDGIAIHGFNSVEWFAADVGASLAACIPAGIYTTNKAPICSYIINHSNAGVLFVDDDQDAMRKILSVRSECESLSKIVVWGNSYDPKSTFPDHADMLCTWDEFLQLGIKVPDDFVTERMELATPGSACKLIYTSGTTGPPKAVVISHDNVIFTALRAGEAFDGSHGDRLVSFLPCSHIAANTSDIVGAILNHCKVYIADASALKGSLVHTMRKARPTVFIGVPRVFEKMQEALLKAGSKTGGIKKVIATWAKGVGRHASQVRDAGENDMPWGYFLANMIVFGNVRKALGLDAARIIINTSAPIQKATDDYFKQFEIRIADLYGMSEATGPFTLNYPDYRAGTSGKVLPGVEAKLINKFSDGEGELCFRGRNMFMGYLGNEEETKETIDEDGYVHSGDLGTIDDEGFITITGRAKELLITGGGENVAPLLVESTLISAMPALCRAFAIGDKLKFISALIIPFMDEEGNLVGPAADVNPNVKTVKEIEGDNRWQQYLRNGISKANEEAMSNAAKVKSFKILTNDFTVEGNELTPTLKIKRKIVVEKYADIITSMYQS